MYTLEPPRRGISNEYPQSMFWSKNKKKYVYPCILQFYYIKVGYEGVYIARTCFPDGIKSRTLHVLKLLVIDKTNKDIRMCDFNLCNKLKSGKNHMRNTVNSEIFA